MMILQFFERFIIGGTLAVSTCYIIFFNVQELFLLSNFLFSSNLSYSFCLDSTNTKSIKLAIIFYSEINLLLTDYDLLNYSATTSLLNSIGHRKDLMSK
jgi:hypothetical protein